MSKIATVSIAISTAVMVVAIAIVIGFKKEIREKITGFNAPIQITKLSINSSLEIPPLEKSWVPIGNIKKIANVKSIHPYTIKAGLIKTDEEIQGVILKGVDSTYDWSFFSLSIGKRLRYARLEYPVPKSSIVRRTPGCLSALRVSSV